MLSRTAKESIKTALAMTIAYGIALSLDWDKAMWTGFTVAMISLSTIGQSINKAALRIVGTLVAAVVALTMIAWFAQDRWLLITAMLVLVGVCTYMMAGPRHQYFWHVLAFVTVIIVMSSNADPERSFYIAVVRAQETGLGILVYSLVVLLLWPTDSRADFETVVKQFAATQHQQYRLYHDRMMGKTDDPALQSVTAAALQQQNQLGQLRAAAQTDSYPVWELRAEWQRYQALVGELAELLAQWRESFNELQALELKTYFLNLDDFHAELDQRFAQIERLLNGQAAESQPSPIELDIDLSAFESLPHFHTAALAFTRSRAHKIEMLTRDWFQLVSDIQGRVTAEPEPAQGPTQRDAALSQQGGGAGVVFDPERMLSAFHVMLFVLLAWLTLIYMEGVPGGSMLLMLGVPISMAMATMPHIPPTKLFIPAAGSVLFAGLVYIFIMPMISSFWGLGMLLFAVTFAICYLFSAPQQALGRALGLALFITITAIENQQSYSFMHVANTGMMFPVFFTLLLLTVHIPFSPLPEKVFLRLLARYFRSAEYLMSTLGKDPRQPLTRTEVWRNRYHLRQVATLPGKLAVWSRVIDPRSVPGIEAGQVQSLVVSLRALSFRISALLEARRRPQAAEVAEHLTQDVRQWRQAIQALFQRWSQEPALAPEANLEQRLNDRLAALEQRISETFEFIGRDKLDQEAYRNFYRLLGGFRGVSEAMLRYARQSGTMNLMQWRESRF
jgi:uncharacterized membrane protein YgaE (UPF0421/DUF939 family)